MRELSEEVKSKLSAPSSFQTHFLRKKFAPEYVEIPKTTPEELAQQQEEIRGREEFEEGEKVWCLHSEDNKFYIGRVNKTNHEMHPNEPFYVHYVVDISKVSG